MLCKQALTRVDFALNTVLILHTYKFPLLRLCLYILKPPRKPPCAVTIRVDVLLTSEIAHMNYIVQAIMWWYRANINHADVYRYGVYDTTACQCIYTCVFGHVTRLGSTRCHMIIDYMCISQSQRQTEQSETVTKTVSQSNVVKLQSLAYKA